MDDIAHKISLWIGHRSSDYNEGQLRIAWRIVRPQIDGDGPILRYVPSTLASGLTKELVAEAVECMTGGRPRFEDDDVGGYVVEAEGSRAVMDRLMFERVDPVCGPYGVGDVPG